MPPDISSTIARLNNTKWQSEVLLHTISSYGLEEFDEQIFNALVEKIDILTPAHFVFELKSGLKVDKIK